MLVGRDRLPLSKVVTPSAWKGIDIVPGSKSIVTLETEPGHLSAPRLRQAFEGFAEMEQYDEVLIDLPPAVGIATVNGLVAADRVVGVTTPEAFGNTGLWSFLETVNEIKEVGLNPGIEVFGVIVNQYQRRLNEHAYHIKELREQLGPRLLEPVVPSRVAAAEVSSGRRPLNENPSDGARALSACFAALAKKMSEAR